MRTLGVGVRWVDNEKVQFLAVRRLIQIALLLLLLILLCGPLFETVDHWDHFAQGGDDLVLNALGVVVGFSLTLLVSFLLRFISGECSRVSG